MLLQFTKMNGAGNDFILIDCRTQPLTPSASQVQALCDRHRGIGADGLILLVPCGSGKADFAWSFFNSDGSTGEMCGNGARCFARFIRRQTGIDRDLTFETEAGVIRAAFHGDRVTVNLTAPRDLRLDQCLPLATGSEVVHSLNTGVPHAVLFVADADKAMVTELGPEIRRHPHFGPRGTNVNFVQVLSPSRIRVRTFERGVEGETLACGTGVTASAIIASRVYGFSPPVSVVVQSGDHLEVNFQSNNGSFHDVTLTGPAAFVFEGQIEFP